MLQLDFVADLQDLVKVINATIKTQNIITKEYKRTLPRNLALKARDLLAQNIISQKYASKYAGYSDVYLNWLKDKGINKTRYWVLTESVLNNLRVFKYRGGWMAGIPAGVTASQGSSLLNDTTGGRPIAMYATMVERGWKSWYGNRVPKRPLFVPTTEEFKHTCLPQLGAESLKRIRYRWR